MRFARVAIYKRELWLSLLVSQLLTTISRLVVLARLKTCYSSGGESQFLFSKTNLGVAFKGAVSRNY